MARKKINKNGGKSKRIKRSNGSRKPEDLQRKKEHARILAKNKCWNDIKRLYGENMVDKAKAWVEKYYPVAETPYSIAKSLLSERGYLDEESTSSCTEKIVEEKLTTIEKNPSLIVEKLLPMEEKPKPIEERHSPMKEPQQIREIDIAINELAIHKSIVHAVVTPPIKTGKKSPMGLTSAEKLQIETKRQQALQKRQMEAKRQQALQKRQIEAKRQQALRKRAQLKLLAQKKQQEELKKQEINISTSNQHCYPPKQDNIVHNSHLAKNIIKKDDVKQLKLLATNLLEIKQDDMRYLEKSICQSQDSANDIRQTTENTRRINNKYMLTAQSYANRLQNPTQTNMGYTGANTSNKNVKTQQINNAILCDDHNNKNPQVNATPTNILKAGHSIENQHHNYNVQNLVPYDINTSLTQELAAAAEIIAWENSNNLVNVAPLVTQHWESLVVPECIEQPDQRLATTVKQIVSESKDTDINAKAEYQTCNSTPSSSVARINQKPLNEQGSLLNAVVFLDDTLDLSVLEFVDMMLA